MIYMCCLKREARKQKSKMNFIHEIETNNTKLPSELVPVQIPEPTPYMIHEFVLTNHTIQPIRFCVDIMPEQPPVL